VDACVRETVCVLIRVHPPRSLLLAAHMSLRIHSSARLLVCRRRLRIRCRGAWAARRRIWSIHWHLQARDDASAALSAHVPLRQVGVRCSRAVPRALALCRPSWVRHVDGASRVRVCDVACMWNVCGMPGRCARRDAVCRIVGGSTSGRAAPRTRSRSVRHAIG
jgi:hypothetical protein